MSAASLLMKAIHARLTGNAGLMTALGVGGIRDRGAPRGRLPCILYGDLESTDYSTATEQGEEIVLTLEVWSDAPGRAEAQGLADRVAALLDRGALVLASGWHLVNFTLLSVKERQDTKTRAQVVELRFRAVMERV